MRFYLGTHHPDWLARAAVPLFVSHRWLAPRRRLPEAAAPWALDSGGFTELSMHGQWRTTVADYAAAVRRYATEIGRLDWAAPQDWMCEPAMLARTGLTVRDHQARTLGNYLTLREAAPDLPFIPVLQGWTLGDYLRHVEEYQRAGIDLTALPLVGIGSVCRRQHTGEIAYTLGELAAGGLRLHAFGVKLAGLRVASHQLASADSMAWSYWGRRTPTACGSTTHRSEQNCLSYALAWRHRALRSTDGPKQLALPLPRAGAEEALT